MHFVHAFKNLSSHIASFRNMYNVCISSAYVQKDLGPKAY